jgi:calmodulin
LNGQVQKTADSLIYFSNENISDATFLSPDVPIARRYFRGDVPIQILLPSIPDHFMTDDPTQYRHSSPEELAGLRETFDALDENKTGGIGARALSLLLREISLPPEVSPLIMFIFDRDHNGKIDFGEFVQIMEAIADLERYPRRFFRMLFEAIDTDGSGLLDPPELVEFARLLNVQLSEADAVEAIDEIDLDGNRQIDFNELCVALSI